MYFYEVDLRMKDDEHLEIPDEFSMKIVNKDLWEVF